MIHDTCDYCRRDFGREPDAPAICLNCGLENARPVTKPPQRETAAFSGAPERAIKIPAKLHPMPRKKHR